MYDLPGWIIGLLCLSVSVLLVVLLVVVVVKAIRPRGPRRFRDDEADRPHRRRRFRDDEGEPPPASALPTLLLASFAPETNPLPAEFTARPMLSGHCPVCKFQVTFRADWEGREELCPKCKETFFLKPDAASFVEQQPPNDGSPEPPHGAKERLPSGLTDTRPIPVISRPTLAAMLGIAAFSGLVLGCIGGGIGGYQLRKGQESTPRDTSIDSSRPAVAPGRVLPRKEFEAAVTGKTKSQITAAVGRPDETQERVPGEWFNSGGVPGNQISLNYDWWLFRGRVQNADTGKPYATVAVRIYDGKADKIDYR